MTPVSRRLHHWVIGDVHGCADSLEQLLERLPAGDRLIFCGDVINRGPAIASTMERIWGLVEQGRAIWLRGNHEQDLITALRRGHWQNERQLAGCDTFRHLGERACRRWLSRWVATHAGFDPETWRPDLRVRMAFWQHYDGRFGEVVIGHTPGPHVRHLPHIVMVDTGACYGGDLSAYCPDTRAVIAVPGLRGSAASLSLAPTIPATVPVTLQAAASLSRC